MDNIDKIIISILQKNARTKLKIFTEKIALSPPAVLERIKQLEREGVVTGYYAEIDPAKLGYYITAFVSVSINSIKKLEFYEYVKSCPNVIECNSITGNYSMFIKVVFPSTFELDAFVNKLQTFGNTQTAIVFSTPIKNYGINIEKDCNLYVSKLT